jgi:branched-chain amino acid aminotransferase
MKIWFDGRMVDAEDAKLSVFDHGLLYGDGVFEGIRVYNGRVFERRAHLDRFYASAERIRLAVPYVQEEVSEAMRQCIEANAVENGYIRLVVTRGPGTLGLNPFRCCDPVVFVIADQIQMYPKEMYEKGMAVIVARTRRVGAGMLDPKVKSLNYLNSIYAKIEAIDAGVMEAVMLNARGNVSEATGDNVFIVRDGAVVTPPSEAGILMGITRGVVLRLAQKLGLPAHEQNFTAEELKSADECFLTGTAAEVIAVTSVDDRQIGDGHPGPVTQRLLKAFRDYIASGDWD